MKKNFLQYFVLITLIVVSIYSIGNSNDIAKDNLVKTKLDDFNKAVDVFVKTEGHFPNDINDDYTCITKEGGNCYFGNLELASSDLVGTDFETFLPKQYDSYLKFEEASASDILKDYIDYEIEEIPTIDYEGKKYGGGIIYKCYEKEGDKCVDAFIFNPTKEAITSGKIIAQAGSTSDGYDEEDKCSDYNYDLCSGDSDCPPDTRSDGSQLYTCENVRRVNTPAGTCTYDQCYCSTCSGGGGGGCPQGYDVCGNCGGTETDPNNCGGCTQGYDACGVCGGGITDPNNCSGHPPIYSDVTTGSCDTDDINISWNNVDNEFIYEIVRDGVVIASPAKNSTSLPVDNLESSDPSYYPGKSYDYEVAYYVDNATYDRVSAGTKTVDAPESCVVEQDNCGSAINNDPSLYMPNSNLCKSGTSLVGSVAADSTNRNWNWQCSGGVDRCEVGVQVSCGSSNGTTVSSEPTGSQLCGNGSSLEGSVNAGGSQWSWTCRNDDAYAIGETITSSCSASCASGEVIDGGVCVPNTISGFEISDYDLDPRFVQTESDTCTINYTLEIPGTANSSSQTNCYVIDSNSNQTTVISQNLTGGTYTGEYSTDIFPKKSYKFYCEYDEAGDGSFVETTESNSVACILNPVFEEF